MRPIPCVPRPYGPVCRHVPAAVSPERISDGCLQNYQVHAAFMPWRDACTGNKYSGTSAHSHWLGRRGALFLHRRMMMRELVARGMWAARTPLNVPNYYDHIRVLQDNIYVPLVGSKVANVLNERGELTAEGFAKLEDTEFVWPYLDEIPKPTTDQMAARSVPHWITMAQQMGANYAQLGAEMEKAWSDHFCGGDTPGDPNGITFASTYGLLLQECGRAGAGTRLGKWLDHWLERADKVYARIYK